MLSYYVAIASANVVEFIRAIAIGVGIGDRSTEGVLQFYASRTDDMA